MKRFSKRKSIDEVYSKVPNKIGIKSQLFIIQKEYQLLCDRDNRIYFVVFTFLLLNIENYIYIVDTENVFMVMSSSLTNILINK